MLTALVTFTHAGITVKQGEVVKPFTFEADDVELLVRGGMLEDDTVKVAEKPSRKSDRKEPKK